MFAIFEMDQLEKLISRLEVVTVKLERMGLLNGDKALDDQVVDQNALAPFLEGSLKDFIVKSKDLGAECLIQIVRLWWFKMIG